MNENNSILKEADGGSAYSYHKMLHGFKSKRCVNCESLCRTGCKEGDETMNRMREERKRSRRYVCPSFVNKWRGMSEIEIKEYFMDDRFERELEIEYTDLKRLIQSYEEGDIPQRGCAECLLYILENGTGRTRIRALECLEGLGFEQTEKIFSLLENIFISDADDILGKKCLALLLRRYPDKTPELVSYVCQREERLQIITEALRCIEDEGVHADYLDLIYLAKNDRHENDEIACSISRRALDLIIERYPRGFAELFRYIMEEEERDGMIAYAVKKKRDLLTF